MKRSWRTWLAAEAIFPLHERIKGHDTVRRLKSLEQSQWYDRDRLAQLQARNLGAFLQDINQHVPYYRDLFREHAFDVRSVRSADALRALPVLSKKDIRDNTERLRADDASKLARFNTGGSSGEPLVFYLGSERVSHDVAAKWRATRWWDVDIGDPEVVLWGSPIELGSQDRVRAFRDRLLRSTLLPAFEMSDEKLAGFVAAIRRIRPRMLFGYPSALAHLAGFAQSRGIPMDDLGIRVAFVTAEQLQPEQKERISRVFNCRVANGYGARDAGFIAHECPAGGLHVCAEDIVVETLDADGNPVPVGTPGELVITHMATRAFPFVRYRTGDVGVLADRDCACGRGLPLLDKVLGRTTDFIVAANGTVMHGLALIYILRDMEQVDRFKIIQESLTRVRVQVVPGAGWNRDCEMAVQRGFKQRLGENVQVDVEAVDDIPPEASGKYRYVVSRVADTAAQGGWGVNAAADAAASHTREDSSAV